MTLAEVVAGELVHPRQPHQLHVADYLRFHDRERPLHARLARGGTTMLIVTHELEALSDIVTRIVVMSGGRVSFDGTPAQFGRARDTLGAVGHDHHHPDEAAPTSGLAGATPTGPLDPRNHTHG